MSRGPDGRYGYQAREIDRTPVAVTCHACGSATSGPIWRGIRAVPSGASVYGVPLNDYVPAVLCQACAPTSPDSVYGSRPCSWCRRPVSFGGYNAHPVRYCSTQCALRSRTARRRDHRELARERRCATCSRPFTAPRADASYCSGACRQRAYRTRQAEQAAEQARGAALMADYNARLYGVA